ncbi:hypothetical protein [Streptomyces sp. MMG1533]|uniref:hypothetical protein n=1 Tax=Streptomyces sp. MMG1533 TaxID=1415546 RepID=UPI00131B86A0|nr:hypothetical protein [Streptomyces sp. MMG1533]
MATAIVGFLGVMAGSLVIASPASAQPDPLQYAVEGNYQSGGGETCSFTRYYDMCFKPYGEVFWLKDDVKNGKAVGIHWRDTTDGYSGQCANHEGVAAGWTYCNNSFPEGNRIEIDVVYYDANDKMHINELAAIVRA